MGWNKFEFKNNFQIVRSSKLEKFVAHLAQRLSS